MDCKTFSTPVSLKLYPYNAVTFDRPFSLFVPIVKPSYATIANGARPIKLIISDFTRINEMSPSTSVGGTNRKVTIEYDVVSSDSIVAIEQLKPLLGHDYHILVSFLGGDKAWIRSTDNSFSIDYSESDGKLHVTITVDTVSGVQRITSESA